MSSIKKAIESLIGMVKGMIENIKNFFKEKFMSADERQRYKEFKQMVKSDPELAKQKVTITDFREYEKAYDEAIKELEKEAAKDQTAEMLDDAAEKITKELSDKINDLASKGKDTATRASLAVTLDTAIQIADRNTACAKAINFALESELIKLDAVEKQLGEKEAQKFKKKINRLANAGFVHRHIVKLLHRKEMTLEAILKNQAKTLLSYTNVKDGKLEKGKLPIDTTSVMNGAIKNPKLTSKALGGADNTAELAKNIAVNSVKVNHTKRKVEKKYNKLKNEVNDGLKFVGLKK
jgi:hypothetical protein